MRIREARERVVAGAFVLPAVWESGRVGVNSVVGSLLVWVRARVRAPAREVVAGRVRVEESVLVRRVVRVRRRVVEMREKGR